MGLCFNLFFSALFCSSVIPLSHASIHTYTHSPDERVRCVFGAFDAISSDRNCIDAHTSTYMYKVLDELSDLVCIKSIFKSSNVVRQCFREIAVCVCV